MDEKEVREISACARVVQYEKGESLVEAGEIQTTLPILVRGVFRGFLIDSEGRDITDCFVYRCGSVLLGSNEFEKPTRISIEAVSQAECLMIPISKIVQRLDEDPVYLKEYNRLLIEALDLHWKGKMSMHCNTAMQRYEDFLKEYPGLITSVSNKDIASFLGMTPVTLSRLRRKLRESSGKNG